MPLLGKAGMMGGMGDDAYGAHQGGGDMGGGLPPIVQQIAMMLKKQNPDAPDELIIQKAMELARQQGGPSQGGMPPMGGPPGGGMMGG